MEQIVYTVTPHRSKTAFFRGPDYVRLLETRLSGLEALAQSLVGCRAAFIESNVDSIMQWVEQQSSHCNEIRRAEQALVNHAAADPHKLPEFLSPDEAERAKELLRRTVDLKSRVQQLNRTYAGMVRKASHNNALLRNLYATALVYADPRIGPGAVCGGTEE